MRYALPFVAFFLLTGHRCHDHTLEDPTSLPPGDATGDAYAGTYEWQLLTVQCDGECESDCLLGTARLHAILLEQNNGYLEASGEISLRGGIDEGGTFDIGGESANAVVARARGAISDAGAVTGNIYRSYRSYREGTCIEVVRLLGEFAAPSNL